MEWLLWLQAVVEVIKILIKLGIIKDQDAQKVAWQMIEDKTKGTA